MKEIDFDELDRAVNSLMNSVPKSKPVKADDDVTVLKLDDVVVPEQAEKTPKEETAPQKLLEETTDTEEPSVDVASAKEPDTTALSNEVPDESTPEEPEPDTQSIPAADTQASVSTAQRGRFMDMVRRSPARPARGVPVAPVSRQGVTLQPSRSVAPTMEPVVPVEPSFTPEASIDQLEDTAQLLEQPASVEQPAVPAMGASSEEVQSQPEPAMPAIGVDMVPPTPAVPSLQETPSPMSQDEPAPLISPFLPDAKVEKRPLGRPAEPTTPPADTPAEAPANDLLIPPLELAIDQPDDQEVSDTASGRDAQLPEQPLPPELGSELLSIETGADSMPVVPSAQPTEAISQPSVETAEAPVAMPALAPVSVPGGNRSTVIASSIPQQYKVEAKADEPPASAIYDTSSYHQPLAHPAKKKPGWLWVVAIVAILILGTMAGAAVYYFDIF